jgi:carboxyl-terminal processing protease
MQWAQLGDVVILKFPWFFYDVDDFYTLSGKIKKGKALIVDLRGNPGGSVDTLKYFIGMFFDHDVKLFDKVERKKTTPEVAKREPHIYFSGKVIVLVDSESASASEIFARVMQLEKRGTVIGDLSSGSVMEATSFYFASSGVDYGAEVTIANLIMTDGKSLEHRKVNPDEVVLPQPADYESGRDPVLAHAAQELGATLSPENAGKLFPYEWPKE